jgi:hypothetical protein
VSGGLASSAASLSVIEPSVIRDAPAWSGQPRDRQALTTRASFGGDDGSMTALGLMSGGRCVAGPASCLDNL